MSQSQLFSLLSALIPTIVIELGVLLLLCERRRAVLWASVAINTLTNVPLNLCLSAWADRTELCTVLLAEVVVFVIEALCYWPLVRRLSQAVVYSALCNAISFLSGWFVLLLFDVYPYIYSYIK